MLYDRPHGMLRRFKEVEVIYETQKAYLLRRSVGNMAPVDYVMWVPKSMVWRIDADFNPRKGSGDHIRAGQGMPPNKAPYKENGIVKRDFIDIMEWWMDRVVPDNGSPLGPGWEEDTWEERKEEPSQSHMHGFYGDH